MGSLKTIDELPTFSGDLTTAYTLVRKGGVTYKISTSALISGSTIDTNQIAGSPINITGLTEGDLLVYSGTTWNNTHKTTLVDGGNF